MSVERFVTNEWNRYTKGKGAPKTLVLLADKQLFDTYNAAFPHQAEGNDVVVMPNTCRMYQLYREGWSLVIEGSFGRQTGTYLV